MAPAQDTTQVPQENLNERLCRIEELLSNALKAEETSLPQSHPKRNLDHRSRFWATYENIARQDDEDLLERYNGTLDVLLIFAGLFSGVSSSFIANTESNLQPDPRDTTNALLQLLVQDVYGETAGVTSIVPSSSGPDTTIIWTQALAYASLSLSLLAAFVAVLGKQWLGHYKNTRFGHGSQEARCIRRQLKLVAMDKSYFYFILDSLPVLLQLSLVSFGISIAGSIYVQQHVLGGIIIGMLSCGVLFYEATGIIGFLYDNSPYQTGLSSRLRNFLRKLVLHFFTDLERHSQNYAHILKSKYRRRFRPGSLSSLDSEEKGFQEFVPRGQIYGEFFKLFLKFRLTDVELQGHLAVKWLLKTSTDPEVIETAINMIPEVVWPSQIDHTPILHRLQEYYVECTRHGYASPLITIRKARACDRAIMHLLWTTNQRAPSTDPPPMIWRFYDPKYRESPEYICARLYRGEKFHRKSLPPIYDSEWLSYMIPYIIILRDRDRVVKINSIPIWCSILKSVESSRTAKLNVLAGIVCALNIPLMTDILASHDKSDLENAMCIGVMYLFHQAFPLESIAGLVNDIPISWYLLEPFSLALNSLSSTVDFDLYPELRDSACWALRFALAVLSIGKCETTSRPAFAIKRIYQSALRICGYVLRQTAGSSGTVEEFHAKISKFRFPASHDVKEKLLDVFLEASGEDDFDLDLAADALLALGIIGWPIPASSSVLEKCIPTLNACLRHTPYHRSTVLYAIWAGQRYLQPSRVAQLGLHLFPSLLHVTPSLRNLTDISLSLMICRVIVKDNGRKFSADSNLLYKLATGILSLRQDFHPSNEEIFVNLARLPIQFIDLCMLIDNRSQWNGIIQARNNFSLTVALSAEPLIEIGVCGWNWFELHGHRLLSEDGLIFWDIKSNIPTRIYTQLYFDFPAILSSFTVWTSGILGLVLREPPDSSHRLLSGDILIRIEQVVDNLIDGVSGKTGRPPNSINRASQQTANGNEHQIRSLLTEFYTPEELSNLDSVRKKNLKNLLTEMQYLKKIFQNSRMSRESERLQM